MKQTMKKRAAVLAAIAALLPCGIHASAEGEVRQRAAVSLSEKAEAPICYDAIEAGEDAAICCDSFCTSVLCPSAAELVPEDQGDLTDAEYAELKALYEKMDAVAEEHADDDAFWDEEHPELDAIWGRIEELEEKSGWYETGIEDGALKDALTDEEYQEYLQINARIDAIFEQIETGVTEDMTEEEYEAAYAPYEDELDSLFSSLDTFYEKAGMLCTVDLDDLAETEPAEFGTEEALDSFICANGFGAVKNSK